MGDAEDAEKMRIRRERAAAWAAKKAAAEAPSSLPKATPLNIEGSSANLVVSVERPVPKDASKRDSFPSWSKHTKTLSGDQNNSSRDEDSQRKRKGAFDDESESKFARSPPALSPCSLRGVKGLR
eukprot:3848814-Rhodomonas_salina.2